MSHTNLTYFSLLTCVAFLAARPANGQPVKSDRDAQRVLEAANHFSRGIAYVSSQNVELAAEEFKQAYRASPNYAVLYNLGQAYAAMGRAVEAVEALRRYLVEGGVQIAPKRRREVERTLTINENRIGNVTLTITPSSAHAFIDGERLADNTTSKRLLAGVHGLAVEADGFKTLSRTIIVVAGQTSSVEARLERDDTKSPSILSVSCAIPDVRVRIDGRERGTTPIRPAFVLTGDRHRVEFERDGYKSTRFDWTRTSAPILDCGMRPAQPLRRSAIRLKLAPRQSEVVIFVDGERASSPLTLPAGKHRIEAKKFGFEPWEQDVVLEPGESRVIAIDMKPERAYALEHLESIRRQRTVAYGLLAGGVAFGVAATVFGVASSSAHDDWRTSRDQLAESLPSLPPQEIQELQQELSQKALHVRTMDAWLLGTAIVSSALVISGGAVFFASESPSRYGSVSPQMTRGAFNLNWSGSF